MYFEPSDGNLEDYYKGTMIFDEEKKLVLEINIELSPNHIKNLKEEGRLIYKVHFQISNSNKFLTIQTIAIF